MKRSPADNTGEEGLQDQADGNVLFVADRLAPRSPASTRYDLARRQSRGKPSDSRKRPA